MIDTTCPTWCAGVQCQEELPEDRHHQSEPDQMVIRIRDRDGHPVNAEVDLVATLEDELWIWMGTADRQGLEITVGSARYLHTRLGVLIEKLGW